MPESKTNSNFAYELKCLTETKPILKSLLISLVTMQEIIKKYPFKEGLKLEFEILDLPQALRSKKNMMTIPHRAQFYHILWIEKGEGTHFIDFHPINLEDHTLIFLPHNCVNMYDKNGTYHGKAILFTDSFFCKNRQDLRFLHSGMLYNNLYAPPKIKVDPQSSDLKVFLNAMEAEYKNPSDSSRYPILHNLLHIFLLQSEREMRKQGLRELKPSANLDDLILFKDLLEQKFRQEKSVNKYASELNISEKQLHKVTSSLLDKTPKQIIDERIILEAKRLLIHSYQSVKEIAYYLGYHEPTNFIKYFRKHTASTPSEFREQY